MFSNQDIDYSLNRPCRCLSAVAPPSCSTSKSKTSKPTSTDNIINDNDGDDNEDNNNMINDGWDDDDDVDNYLENSSNSFTSHRFLIGSSIPSVSKLPTNSSTEEDGDDDDDNNAIIIEEDDEERTNRLYLLQYHEESHELTQESSWVHPTEVWSMGCHPTRGDWVVTCGGGAVFSPNMLDEEEGGSSMNKNVPLTKFQTTLWRIPDISGDDNNNNDDDDEFDFDKPRGRTESGASALSSSSSKLERVVTIPHGENSNTSTATASSGWEQRVGQILWNPLLYPSQSSGDALYDLADTASNEGGGNLITVGWDANKSPISLWDISSLSEAKEVWSTHNNGGSAGVESSRSSRRSRFANLANTMNSALPRRVSWDPHDTHNILATCGVDVLAYDMRISPASGLGAIRSAHRYGVTDVCHNHLQSNVVFTSGMDGIVKFWDLRMHLSDSGLDPVATTPPPAVLSAPPLLKAVRGGHSHWTTHATYNPFYDQLVLSGGSDGIANLWRISSCSSAPLLDLDDDEEDDDEDMDGGSSFDGNGHDDVGGENENSNDAGYGDDMQEHWMDDKPPSPKSVGDEDGELDDNKEDKIKSSRNEASANDIRVTRFECSDVTADLSWSASDPWVYATLSCDGAIVVHHVPSKEKYKILL